jgi:hypothetical protein
MRTILLLTLGSSAVVVAAIACSSSEETPSNNDAGPDTSAPDAADQAAPPIDADVDAAIVVHTDGFETGSCESWTVVGGKVFTTEAIAASGTKSCRICMQTASSVYIDLAVATDKVGPYILNAKVRNESAKAFGSMTFTDDNDASADAAPDAYPDFGTFRAEAAVGNDFAPMKIQGTPTQAPNKVRLRFGAEKDGGLSCIDVDDVALTLHL